MEDTKSSGALTWIVVALIIIGGIFFFTRSGNAPEATGPIKIGFIGPLSGDAAMYGEVVRNGVILAAKELNAKGGINGRPVNIIYEDGKCNGKDSSSAAQKLINVDTVKFIVDGDCSGAILGAASIFEQAKVLVLAAIATNPKIADAGDYIFRNAPNDSARGVLLADYAKSLYKKAAVITEQTDYAQGIKNTFTEQAKSNGLEVAVSEDYVTGSNDFRTSLSKIKAANPDVVLINPQTGADFVRIAKQARQLGIKAPFIGAEFNGPEVLEAGAAVEGTVIAIAPGLSADGKGKTYLDAYKAEFGKEPAYAYYSGAGYDDLMIIADGISKAGYDTAKVKDYLYSLPKYSGVIGDYSFDKNGDVVGIKFLFTKIIGGKFVDQK